MFKEQIALIQNKIFNETMQKTSKINRGFKKDFESKDTINRLLAKRLQIPYSDFKNYGLKRITFTNDITCTCAKWKKKE